MGAGLYLVWPAFYTDVTDSYRLGRGGRVRTDLGGLYFNAIVAVAVTGVWWVSGNDALLLVVATQILQMLQQLTPLVRFDGYHVLADVTGVPDLFHRIKPTLLGVLPWRWGDPEARLLKPWARAVVTLWVVVVVPLLLLALLGLVLTLPRILGTAWARIQQEQDLVGAAWSDGDLVQLAARVLTIVAVVLPVAAIVYMLVRLGRQVAVGTWRSTAGRPVRRTVAAGTALALAAALAWVWWPRARHLPPDPARRARHHHRPGPPGRRAGPARFVEPVAAAAPGQDAAEAAAPTVARGDRGALRRSGTPTRPCRPRTSRSSPSSSSRGPTPPPPPPATPPSPTGGQPHRRQLRPPPAGWVFPFDRPLAPEAGDNQALAENTTDGTVQYDVALAMVWVEGGEDALNTNEAYAFASCNTCASVAVAFQVVIVIGDNDVAVPQNLAGAVNYNCVNCLTYAIAQQLFITLDGPLSDEAMAELDEIWAQIAEFGQNITGVPLDQIDDRLDEFEQQILTVIETDQPGTVPQASPSAVTSGSATPSPSAAPSGGSTSPSAGASGSATPSPGVSPSASPGASASTSPSPTGTSSGTAAGTGTASSDAAAGSGSTPAP